METWQQPAIDYIRSWLEGQRKRREEAAEKHREFTQKLFADVSKAKAN